MGITGSIGTLLNFLLEIYAWLILGRVLLSWVNPDPYNPIVQFLVRATEPVLEPFRRWIPSFAGLDLSPIVALLAVHFTQRIVVTLFHGGMGGGAIGSLIAEMVSILHLLVTFYMLLLLARGGFHVHSWHTFRKGEPPGIDLRKPLIRFVFQATEPALRPLRRFVPNFSGLDISPFAAAVVLLLVLSILQELMVGVSGARLTLHG